jgi:WD40 repeat protein
MDDFQVNTICWNESGRSILSGSDDQHLIATDPFSGKVSICIVNCPVFSTLWETTFAVSFVVYNSIISQ